MNYPLTPDYIRNAPKPIEKLYRKLEEFILNDICSRLQYSDNLTSTALEEIRTLRRRGYDIKAIEAHIKKTLKLSEAEWNGILNQAVLDNQRYYASVLGSDLLLDTVVHSDAIQSEINAILAQTNGTFENLTQSMGFSVNVNGVRTFMPIAKAYQQVLDNAEMRVWSGTQSYNEAIRDAVGELADSGIKAVTWDNNGKLHVDRADVATRRAVMTGITQLGSKFSEQIREEVPTEYIEITAHRGARDKGIGWQNHKAWQGKVYSTRTGDKYPNIYSVCGWGEVDGLEGANCRHLHYPFWDGISERTWTDEQLANIDPKPFTWKDGKTYSAYESTQKMRSIERQIRKTKRELIAFKANGDKDAYQGAAIRYKRLNDDYEGFSKAAGLRKQDDRRNIAEFTPTDGKQALKAAMQA